MHLPHLLKILQDTTFREQLPTPGHFEAHCRMNFAACELLQLLLQAIFEILLLLI